jgi:hypothetical protein
MEGNGSPAADCEGGALRMVSKVPGAHCSLQGVFHDVHDVEVPGALVHRKALDAGHPHVEAVQGTLHFTRPLDADADPRIKGLRSILTSKGGGPADATVRGGYWPLHEQAGTRASRIEANGCFRMYVMLKVPIALVHRKRWVLNVISGKLSGARGTSQGHKRSARYAPQVIGCWRSCRVGC